MDDVEKIKQKIDIVELINEYLPLKKGGRNFKANCPFHGEKTPSFTVSAERQIWHCFGCQKGGDIFSFLMEYERIDFSEALKILAGKANIKLTTTPFRTDLEKKRDIIYTLNSLAAQFYHYILISHKAGESAYKYLEERKIDKRLMDTFNLGYAPGRTSLAPFLTKKKGYSANDLSDAGLAFMRNGKVSDFFYDRIIFPIYDTRGNIIAFSGRVLSDDLQAGPKYINTKETLVYKKGDTLYGIQVAKEEIKKEGRAILVEGEFDAISSFREGIGNVVAVKGTSLTENQIKLLKRFASKISFCFDTDSAGVEAQKRSIALIEKEGVQATVIIPPEGKDPDELLRQNPLLFHKAVKKDVNIYDFIIDTAASSHNALSSEGKKKILEATTPYLAAIDNEVIKEHYLKKLSNILDVSLESVSKEVEREENKRKNPVAITQVVAPKNNASILEEYFLALLLQSQNTKELLSLVQKLFDNAAIPTPSLEKLFLHIKEYFVSHDKFDHKVFVLSLAQELVPVFDTCFLYPIQELSEEGFKKELLRVAKDLRVRSIKNALQNISREIVTLEKDGKESEAEEKKTQFVYLTKLLSTSQKEQEA